MQVEIDAISAIALGLTATELLRMYESQFRTLRRYENETYFDAHGSKVARDHNTFAPKQALWESELREAPMGRGERRLGSWARVQAYLDGDTAVSLGPLRPPFIRADRALAMRKAHERFAELAGGKSE